MADNGNGNGGFVPIQKRRKPGPDEKADPTCSGTGRVDNHVCRICHGSGVVPQDWKPGDGPVSTNGNGNGNGS
jgi:DnaJ-class molecular chaperone